MELVLLGVLINMQNQVEAEAQRLNRARKINDEVNKIFHSIVIIGGMPKIVRTRQEGNQIKIKLKEIQDSIAKLKDLTIHDQSLFNDVLLIDTALRHTREDFTLSVNLIRNASPDDLQEVLRQVRKKLDSDLQVALHAGITQLSQRSLEGLDEARSAQSRKQVEFTLYAGAALSVLVAIAAASIYSRDLSKRLARVSSNASKLANDQPLDKPVPGEDEIAELDRALHFAARWMEAAEKKERAIISYASDIICTLDKGMHISSINPRGLATFKKTNEELLHSDFVSLFKESDRSRVRDALQSMIETTQAQQFDAALDTTGGDDLQVTISASYAPSQKSFYCVIHDITERTQVERLRQEVTAMITHDLRTPLQTVRNYLELLENNRLGELNEQGQRLLKFADKETLRMAALIDSVLQLEKLRSGAATLDKKDVVVADLIQRSIAAVTILASEKSIAIEYKPDSSQTLFADAKWLEQVIVNLLANAIKFSPESSTVSVECAPVPSFLEISINDQGPGIPAAEKALIFERFHRIPTSRNVGGSGLGLAICKELIDLHGGYIHVDSVLGKGSKFIVGIPLPV